MIQIEQLDVSKIFEANGLNDVLEQIQTQARSFVPDLKTKQGRKNIASLAARVARSKTALDDLGKNLVSEWKKKSKAVDAERRRMRDTLDDLKAEIRQPLTDWENAEKKRLENHEACLNHLEGFAFPNIPSDLTSELAKQTLEDLNGLPERDWEEYELRAMALIKDARSLWEKKIAELIEKERKAEEERKQREAEQAELARLRKAEEERLQKEREEQLKAEAIEEEKRARIAAEENAKRAEREKIAAEAEAKSAKREAAARAILEAEEAKKRAEQEKQEAIIRERERVLEIQKAKEEEAAKRQADKNHRDSIIRDIFEGFLKSGFSEDDSKKITECLMENKIPHITINY